MFINLISIYNHFQMLQVGGLFRSASIAGAGASSSSSQVGSSGRPAPLSTKRQSNALSASLASGPSSSGPLGLRATRQKLLDAEDVTDDDAGVETLKQKRLKCDDRARSRALLKLLRVMDVKVCYVICTFMWRAFASMTRNNFKMALAWAMSSHFNFFLSLLI
jgi:hypothetical protein